MCTNCLLHSPRWEHGYLWEFLHTPQQYEAFSTFFTLTGCFSAFIFGGFVFMWFSSGGRCLYYRAKLLHTLDWYGLSYVSSLERSEGWRTASPDDSHDLTSGNRHSIPTAVYVWCAVSCICCWGLLPCPLLSTLMDIWWRYFLVLSFRRSLNCEVSLMRTLVWHVTGDFYNSDLNGEVTCLKCLPMFFRPAHQCELKFRDGPPD